MVIDLLKSANKPSELMAILKIKFGDYSIEGNEEPLSLK